MNHATKGTYAREIACNNSVTKKETKFTREKMQRFFHPMMKSSTTLKTNEKKRTSERRDVQLRPVVHQLHQAFHVPFRSRDVDGV